MGLGLTAALGAFALVPTEKLQPPPSKPLFFYLVPLLRIQVRPGGWGWGAAGAGELGVAVMNG